MRDDIKVYYSIRETSQRYGVGVSTIYDWMKTSHFPKPNKLGPKLVRFHIDDLLRWENQQMDSYTNDQWHLWEQRTSVSVKRVKHHSE